MRTLAMGTRWWRRTWPVLERVLAGLIWLQPATGAFFRSSAAEEDAAEVVEAVVYAALAV